MTLDPRIGFFLGVVMLVVLYSATGSGAAQLSTIFGAATGATISGVCAYLGGILGIVVTALHAVPSGSSPADLKAFYLGPSATPPAVPPAAKALILLAIISAALLLPGAAFAQTKRHVPAITGNPIQDIKTDINGGVAVPAGSTGGQVIQDQLEQLEAKFNGQVLVDLQSSLALASQKDANGQTADATAVPCYTALISLTNLINGMNVPVPVAPAAGVTPPASAPSTGMPSPQLITHLEKLRIVKNALGSQAFKDACAPLVQDIQSSGNQLLASVLGIVGGAAKLGIAIP